MIRVLLLLLPALLLQGCASSSLFMPYPSQAESWRSSLSAGTASGLATPLASKAAGKDNLLYLQEMGRLEQLAGNHDASLNAFSQAIADYEAGEADARIQASGLAAGTASLLTNDNALPYPGYPYERIFVHAYQAFNYLAQGNREGAQVELRRAALEQRQAELENEKRIAKAEEEAQQKNVDLSSYDGYFQGLNTAAAGVRSAVNNAWTFYLSGVIWEASGDFNAALVDYKNALQVVPDSDLLIGAVERASARLNRRWNPQQGLVVILHEEGLVPPRRELSIPIPTVHGYFSVAFPTYQATDLVPPQPLQVRGGDSASSRTEVLARVNAMAARTLKDRIPGMLVRQTLRAATKYEAQKQANENLGLLGAITTQVYNLVSERADLRSWLSLPAYGMAAEIMLPAGEQTIVLSAPGASASVTVPVRPGGITLVRAVHVGNLLRTEVYP